MVEPFRNMYCSIYFVSSFSAMALDKQIGNFVCGKEFDALIVDPDVKCSPMNIFDEDTVSDVVEKFLYTGNIFSDCT